MYYVIKINTKKGENIMKKCIYASLIILVSCALIFSSCAAENDITDMAEDITAEQTDESTTDGDASVIDDEEPEAPVETVTYAHNDNAIYVSGLSDRYETFDTQSALLDASENVITGRCVSSTSSFAFHELMQTVSMVYVTESYKGEIKKDSVIFVVELGGTCTASEYIDATGVKEKAFYENAPIEVDDDTIVISGLDNFYPMNAGEEVLLFLGPETSYKDHDGNHYSVVGSTDGKLYKTSADTYSRPDPEAAKNAGAASYSLQSSLNKSDLIINVNDLTTED